MLTVGDRVAGRYRLVLPLGERRGGAVYRAEESSTGEAVVLALAEGGEDRVARFVEVMRAASKVDHPNVVRVIEVGAEHGRGFAATELLEGRALEERLAERPPLTLADFVLVATAALDGLAALHAAGVAHGEIDPSNVFLVPGGERPTPKLIGMGFGLDARDDAPDGGLLGRLRYVPPELLADKARPTPAGDVYSFGVVLWEALAGKPPFSGETPELLRKTIRDGRAETLYAVRPDLPIGLSRAVQRAIAPRPEGRHVNVAALQKAVVSGLQVAPEPVKLSPLPRPWDGEGASGGVAEAAPAPGGSTKARVPAPAAIGRKPPAKGVKTTLVGFPRRPRAAPGASKGAGAPGEEPAPSSEGVPLTELAKVLGSASSPPGGSDAEGSAVAAPRGADAETTPMGSPPAPPGAEGERQEAEAGARPPLPRQSPEPTDVIGGDELDSLVAAARPDGQAASPPPIPQDQTGEDAPEAPSVHDRETMPLDLGGAPEGQGGDEPAGPTEDEAREDEEADAGVAPDVTGERAEDATGGSKASVRSRRWAIWVGVGVVALGVIAVVLVAGLSDSWLGEGRPPGTVAGPDGEGRGAPSEPPVVAAMADAEAPARPEPTDDRNGGGPPVGDADASPADAEPRAPDEAPATVRITLRGLPDGARVALDGARVQGGELELPASGERHEVEVVADGFRPWRRVVVPSEDTELSVQLERVPAHAPSPPPRPRPPRDPRPGQKTAPRIVRDPGF